MDNALDPQELKRIDHIDNNLKLAPITDLTFHSLQQVAPIFIVHCYEDFALGLDEIFAEVDQIWMFQLFENLYLFLHF